MSERIYKNLSPTEDRLLIKPEEISEVTPGGIHLPISHTKKNRRSSGRGTVLAKGPGRIFNGEYRGLDVRIGDVVVIGEFAGSEINHDGEDLLLVNWVEILAVLPQPVAVGA